MHRRLLVATLLATTSLTAPQRAEAGLVSPFLSGLVASFGASATTAAVASAIGGATFAGFSVGTFLTTTFVGKIILSLGLSALASALTPKPQVPEASARLANFAQPVSYLDWAFGRCRKGGPLGFTGFQNSTDTVTGTAGRKRHYSVILAAHEIEGIVAHYMDERTVAVDANGLSTTAPMAGYYRIRPFLGAAGQTADAELTSSFTEMTSAHDFAGLSGAHIWAKKPPDSDFADVYPSGRQGAWTPVIDGNNQVYDPRDNSYKFTRNAALIIAYWITEILGQQVDWTEVGEEADASDVTVTNKDAGTQAKWMINGAISDDQEFEDQRAQMAVACDAWLYERADGKVGFKVGRWIEPTITLTAGDFFSCETTEGSFGSGAPSEVAVRYVDPANKYREATSGPYVIDATAREKRDEPQLNLVTSHNQASRMAKRIAKATNPPSSIRGTIGLIGYSLIGQRFVKVENTEAGIDAYFEIGRLERDEGGLSFSIEANETASTDFDYDAATEEDTPPTFGTVTGSADLIDTLTLSGTSQSGGSILWELTSTDPSLYYQMRTRVTGAATWTYNIALGHETDWLQTGLLGGVQYEAQVRSVSQAGVATSETDAKFATSWQPGTSTKVTVDTETPDDLVSVTMTGETGQVRATGTGPTWTNFRGVNFYKAATGAGFGAAVKIGAEQAASPATAFNLTATTAADTADYYVAPVGNTGTEGAADGPWALTVS